MDGRSLLDANGAVRIDWARSWIAARLPRVPRLRQVIEYPRRGLGGPLWVDAPDIDLSRHIGVRAVRPPADESALLAEVQGLMQRRLDPARPLGEMWLLPGLPDGRLGLFVRLHHVVADGIAGLSTLVDLLRPTAEPVAAPWSPHHRRIREHCCWTMFGVTWPPADDGWRPWPDPTTSLRA